MSSPIPGQQVHDEKSRDEASSQQPHAQTLEKTSTSPNHSTSSTPTKDNDVPPPPPDGSSPTELPYPEGGLRAYLVVFGAFSGMVAAFGLMNTMGSFQTYLSTHQLSQHSPSTIGWIFSLYVFLAFFCGVQIGPVFDAKGPRWLVAAGTVCLVVGMIGISESIPLGCRLCIPLPLQFRKPSLTSFLFKPKEYWHFLLSFSLLGGVGTSLIFTPAISSISHFFLATRASAVGLAATGGSIGGIVFPLMLQRLFPLLGFKWAVRILTLIFLFLLLLANLLIRSRLPPKIGGTVWPDFRIFRNKTFALTTAGVFFVEWGLFIPLSYISSYALHTGRISPTVSYQLLAVVNVGSFFGRWLPGYIADRFGRFNTVILTVAVCILCILGIWLTAAASVVRLIVFSLGFGFASGSNISLTPVCVGQLCDTEEFGRWYATCYTVVSFGCLTGIPIAGQILQLDGGDYWGLIIFAGACYVGGLACFVAARVSGAGWGIWVVY